MSNTTPPNHFNDQQEHYKSLISLFKFCISVALILLSAGGLLIGYITSTNGKDMREDLKEQKEALNNQVKEIKADLEKQQSQLYEREEKIENRITLEVQNTKEDALAQISNTKNIATNEARDRIDQVFRDKNFDAFVEKVAKERMEPQIQKMVDNKIAKIDSLEKNKINQAVIDVQSNDMTKVSDGITVLQNNLSFSLTDDQILKLCNQLKDLKEPFKNKLLVAVYNRKSPVIIDFFKRSVIGDNEFANSMLDLGLYYIMNYDTSLDIQFCKNFIVSHDHRRGRMYWRLIGLSQAFNENLTIQLLNSKDIIEYVYDSEEMTDFKLDILILLQNSKIPAEVYNNTYFFNRVSTK